MRWTGASERSAKNWLSGVRGPSGTHLVALTRNSPAVLDAFLRLGGNQQIVVAAKISEVRDRLIELLELIISLSTDQKSPDRASSI